MDKKKLRGKKKLMISALKAQLGIITAACKAVEISRETHYRWLKEDPNYKLWVDELPDLTLDFVENALLKNIKSGNVVAQIFYLKTKGKERGYIEKQEIDSNVKIEGIDKLREAIKSGVPYQ